MIDYILLLLVLGAITTIAFVIIILSLCSAILIVFKLHDIYLWIKYTNLRCKVLGHKRMKPWAPKVLSKSLFRRQKRYYNICNYINIKGQSIDQPCCWRCNEVLPYEN